MAATGRMSARPLIKEPRLDVADDRGSATAFPGQVTAEVGEILEGGNDLQERLGRQDGEQLMLRKALNQA